MDTLPNMEVSDLIYLTEVRNVDSEGSMSLIYGLALSFYFLPTKLISWINKLYIIVKKNVRQKLSFQIKPVFHQKP